MQLRWFHNISLFSWSQPEDSSPWLGFPAISATLEDSPFMYFSMWCFCICSSCSCLDVCPRTAAFQICETHSCASLVLLPARVKPVSARPQDATLGLSSAEVARNSLNSSRVKHGRKSRIDRRQRQEVIDASGIRMTTPIFYPLIISLAGWIRLVS